MIAGTDSGLGGLEGSGGAATLKEALLPSGGTAGAAFNPESKIKI